MCARVCATYVYAFACSNRKYSEQIPPEFIYASVDAGTNPVTNDMNETRDARSIGIVYTSPKEVCNSISEEVIYEVSARDMCPNFSTKGSQKYILLLTSEIDPKSIDFGPSSGPQNGT